MKFTRFVGSSAALLAALALGGCAQEVGDIDRTSDNALDKSMFDGEWYMLQTVVDTDAQAVWTFAGLQGPLERVSFDFDSAYLYARRTHEDVQNLDTAAVNLIHDLEFEGSMVAAWPAQHFDIQRQYNAATGEESNVLTENASDRQWYDRDYARVGWTNNMISTIANEEFSTLIEGMGMISLSPEQNDLTLNVEENEDGEVYYFDYVSTYIAEGNWQACVETVGFPSWGTDCGTERIVVRTSFLKVDDDITNAHVPREYDDHDMNLFGYFRTNRCYYDERYGCTDFSRIQIANVHDIWTNDRYEDGSARPYYEREADPIAYYLSWEYPIDLIDEAYEISEQFSWAFRRTVAGAQGVPVADVPRMFYTCLNPGTTDPTVPEEYLEMTHNPADRELLIAAYAASAEGYENGACEAVGERKNQGDLRYNFFNWRNDPSAPWYGYGPSAADPLTGEIIQGVANFNGGHLSYDAQRILNYVKIVAGDLTAEDYGYGMPIQDYFDDLRASNDFDMYYGLDQTPGAGDKAFELELAVDRHVGDILDASNAREAELEVTRELMADEHLQGFLSRPLSEFRVRSAAQTDPLAEIVGTNIERQLMLPEFTTALSSGALQPGQEYDDELYTDAVSPVRLAREATVQRRAERDRDRWMERNLMMADDFDYHIAGFQDEIYRYKTYLETEVGLTPEEVDHELWLEIRGRIYTGVQSHEIGHTVGLRHNFAATGDAMNYFPQYWALRQQTFDNDCDGDGVRTFDAMGYARRDNNVAPAQCAGGESAAERADRAAEILARLRTGVTAEGTQLGSIDHFEYSSVMDYHGDFNGRQGGLGLYDYASLAYGYAEMVETFDAPPHRLEVTSAFDPRTNDPDSTTVERGTGLVTDMSDVDDWHVTGREAARDPLGDNDELRDNRWDFWHYSVLPMMFYDETSAAGDDPIADGRHPDHIDFTEVGGMARMYDRTMVSASTCHGADCGSCTSDAECGGGQVCYRSPFDPRQQNDSRDGRCVASDAPTPLLTNNDVVVPYKFCSDHRRGSSSLCNIWDGGADELEVVTRMIDDYESYYPVSFFRRGRPAFLLFGIRDWAMRLESRTFRPAVDQFKFWLINASRRGYEWYGFERAGLVQTLAMEDAINFVSGVWTNPTVGSYAPDYERDGLIVNFDEETGERLPDYDVRFGGVLDNEYIDIGVADGGRYGFSQYLERREDGETGFYYWLHYDVISHFWTKYAALLSFMDGYVSVIGADSSSDAGAYYLTPFTVFPDQVGNHLGAILAEDWGNLGLCATRGEDGEWELNNIDLFRGSNYRCDGEIVNPYTEEYSNRDYNMKLFTTVWAAAFFHENLDYSWLDQSSVYVWGAGDQPAFINDRDDEQYDWLTYTDDRGVTYAARYISQLANPDADGSGEPAFLPNEDPDDYNSDYGPNVGYRLVERAIDLQVLHDELEEAEAEAARNNDPYFRDRTATDVYYELQNHLEIMRFVAETNRQFEDGASRGLLPF